MSRKAIGDVEESWTTFVSAFVHVRDGSEKVTVFLGSSTRFYSPRECPRTARNKLQIW